MGTDFLLRFGVDPSGCTDAPVTLPQVHIGPETVRLLPELAGRFGDGGTCTVVADSRTWAAGRTAVAALKQGGMEVVPVVLASSDPLVPDERAIGEALVRIPEGTGCLIALGSGTVTDLTRYLAYRLGKPFISVPTAPSVDGYTSAHSPLIIDRLKRTIPARVPVAVVADTRILADAPARMKAAGLGDMLGKYTARLDWQIAQIVAGENICGYADDLSREGLDRCIRGFRQDPDFGEESVGLLMEGLVLSGIAMHLAGTSRPASGSEHHLSHFLEMKSLRGELPGHLHGEKVAFGTLLISRLYRKIFSLGFDDFRNLLRQSGPAESSADRTLRLKRAYGTAAPERIEFWRSTLPCCGRDEELEEIFGERWSGMQESVRRELPSEEELVSIMTRVGLHTGPAGLGYDRQVLEDAVICAKEISYKYSILYFLDELGILERSTAELLEDTFR